MQVAWAQPQALDADRKFFPRDLPGDRRDLYHRFGRRTTQAARAMMALDSKFTRHFTEWQGGDLAGHIQSLYDQAVADQFPF